MSNSKGKTKVINKIINISHEIIFCISFPWFLLFMGSSCFIVLQFLIYFFKDEG